MPTVTRMPRIHGFPPMTSGLVEMRSKLCTFAQNIILPISITDTPGFFAEPNQHHPPHRSAHTTTPFHTPHRSNQSMNTLKRIAAARANGAKSQGPSTEQGKQRAALNATRHGLLSKTIVLKHEDPKEFQALVTQYVEKFRPNGDIEHQAVEEMAICQWKLRRLRLMEKYYLDLAAAQIKSKNPDARIAEGFDEIANSHALDKIERYETKLQRMYHRALEHFLLLRELDPEPEPEPAAAEDTRRPEPVRRIVQMPEPPDRYARSYETPEEPLTHQNVYNAGNRKKLS